MMIESMREEFRGYRAQFVGRDTVLFDARVRMLAETMSDGEQPGPLCYLNAAREVMVERVYQEGPWAKKAA